MTRSLSSSIRPGVVRRAGTTPESHKLLIALLEDDRKTHHCFFNKMGFHNHLSHHLLAAYDLGASAKLLQDINDDAQDGINAQRPINLDEPHAPGPITEQNWTEHLGDHKYYSSYLAFFLEELSGKDITPTLEKYIFSPAANGNGSNMFARFMGGALHPFIQTGYAAEFGNDPMIAQALAMSAMTVAFVPTLFEFDAVQTPKPTAPLSLFEIIRKVYDSDKLHPAMPYDNDALFPARVKSVAEGGGVETIRELASQWFSASEEESISPADLARKHEELMWLATLLVAGSGRPGRKPRLDFFLMHILNSSIFVPSLLPLLPSPALKVKLLKSYCAVTIFLVITRGRPRIDPALMMSYSATPVPPRALKFPPSLDAVGDPNDRATANPWDVIVPCVMHAPDSHIIKCIRALYYASQQFGYTGAGEAPGALDKDGKETHKGIKEMDGSIFVRAAGVAMDQLGWVTYGEKAGWWDGTAHGWDDAWKNED